MESIIATSESVDLSIPADFAQENALEAGFTIELVTQEELDDYMVNGTYAPANGGSGVIHLFY